MAYQAFLTADAAIDLEELHTYILTTDGAARARHVLQRIEAALDSLTNNPDRGPWPMELRDLGIRDYREVFFKPYRIIYRIVESSVYVMMVVDGRRDMQNLLHRRLLR